MQVRQPLVIGYPRTGFTLLISVISEVLATRLVVASGRHALKALCDGAGWQISVAVERAFGAHGREDALIYNDNFRQMVGGPKWLKADDPQRACFRKYIGVRGDGDFTLFTSHPRAVLRYYEIMHSHVAPTLWPGEADYRDHARFASMRDPAGTVTSACFSLNALASEYIQRFMPVSADNDELRQRIALYKLTDLNFFEALLNPFKAYMEEFATCADSYTIMRWEDLIGDPVPTIRSVATALDLEVTEEQAGTIWARIDHVNLTGAHKHNLRVGQGRLGGWRDWITNTHLEMLREHGFSKVAERFGYGPIEDLDPAEYTPFQQQVADALARGEILRTYDDYDLFGLAFNKSNVDLRKFSFKQYGWRTHTSIERSSCSDDDFVMACWDAAEAACGTMNAGLEHWFAGDPNASLDARRHRAGEVCAILRPVFASDTEGDAFAHAFGAAIERDEAERGLGSGLVVSNAAPAPADDNPHLLKSVGRTNLVRFRDHFYGLPQSLGPVDFHRDDVAMLPGVVTAEDMDALLRKLAR